MINYGGLDRRRVLSTAASKEDETCLCDLEPSSKATRGDWRTLLETHHCRFHLFYLTMDGSQPTQPTQQATQPYADPRRQARTLSEMSENDAADIICVLHANSPMAARAVRATMLSTPEHILQNDDLDGVTEDDLAIYPELEKRTREIALRMDSTVKLPREGFRFGRNPQNCDILLTENPRDRLVSNVHFKIYVHEQGSLMIQDCSTNGTIVDDEILKSKDKGGRPLAKPGKRVLRNGAIITVLVGPDRQEIKLMVRVPNRVDYEGLYEEKLRRYLAVRGLTPNFASVRESSFGNHWTGGSTYNFTGLLGKGAFATVYRVQTKSEGTIYAAKEIDKRRFIKNGILDIKFDNELQIMRKLKHPNIVDYFDCQSYESWIYIIMEYIPYGELSKELQTKGRFPEHEVQQITKQTLRALDYLHRQGITHRDIKPDNILIASRDPLLIKLSDFGLSKSVVDQETFLKTFCGTLLYCAPEVYPDYNTYAQPPTKRRRHSDTPSKTAPYDSSADMWSFGAVIFHLLAGKAPIMGRGENGGAQMLNNIMTKPVDFTPLRDLAVSDAAIDFIAALLNRQPALRPKEQDCFQHPWLKHVPEVLDYSTVADVHLRPGRLEDVEEADEDEADEELINDLHRLTQNPELFPAADDPPSTPSSPERPAKKPKMIRAQSTIPEDILYPRLPSDSSQTPAKAQPLQGPKLFGEITPSILKSSGLFGMGGGPSPDAAAHGSDMPQIRNKLEQVSMNDWATSTAGGHPPVQPPEKNSTTPGIDISYAVPHEIAASAASLMGAEAQMYQMNMGSQEAAFTDVPTPETNNPVTPREPAGTPHSVSISAGEPSSQHSIVDDKSRRIDVNLLADDAAFAAEQKLRQAAREENARLKAQTFHVMNDSAASGTAAGIAKTFSTPFQRSLQNTGVFDRQSDSSDRTEVFRQLSTNIFPSSLDIFGRLTPVEGSFDHTPIPLTTRSTLWGRAPQCNCRFTDLQDARVPKLGMKIVFYAPGIEDVEREGGDWSKVPRIRTIIATSATRGIKVNDVRLLQESEDGKAALFGKLYTGDVITIVDSELPGAYLKYRVEILFGNSALPRPEMEQPFIIQREYNHHAKMKEQSMRVGSHHNDENLPIPAITNEVTVA